MVTDQAKKGQVLVLSEADARRTYPNLVVTSLGADKICKRRDQLLLVSLHMSYKAVETIKKKHLFWFSETSAPQTPKDEQSRSVEIGIKHILCEKIHRPASLWFICRFLSLACLDERVIQAARRRRRDIG